VAWILLLAAISLEVGATLSLRASEGFTKWAWSFPVAIGYIGSFILLALVLKKGMPVGIAYGVWSAIGVAATAILGRFLFGDPFTALMAFGVVLIGAGVLLLELGSGAHTTPS
jgi:small multidrug resistance pump